MHQYTSKLNNLTIPIDQSGITEAQYRLYRPNSYSQRLTINFLWTRNDSQCLQYQPQILKINSQRPKLRLSTNFRPVINTRGQKFTLWVPKIDYKMPSIIDYHRPKVEQKIKINPQRPKTDFQSQKNPRRPKSSSRGQKSTVYAQNRRAKVKI